MKTQRSNKEAGSVLAELSFVAPVILIMISGVISLGQGISQIAWVSETAFQAALVGAEHAEQQIAEGSMVERAQELRDTAVSFSRAAALLSDDSITAQQDRANRMVTVSFRAGFTTLFGDSRVLPVTVSVTAPILTNLDANVGNLGTFANPSQLRDCEGDPCTGGSCPTQCLQACTIGGTVCPAA